MVHLVANHLWNPEQVTSRFQPSIHQLFTTHVWMSTSPASGPQRKRSTLNASLQLHMTVNVKIRRVRQGGIMQQWSCHNGKSHWNDTNMVRDQDEHSAKGVFAVVQKSWDGFHFAVLLTHGKQPGAKYHTLKFQLHLSLVLRQKQWVESFTWDWGVLLSQHIQWEVFQHLPDWEHKQKATI